MVRGRSPTYDSQREQILAQAAALFAQRGYPGTSMNEVAEACGLSKPTLYHYVRDKHELLVLITQGHIDRLEAVVHEVTQQNLAPEPRLRRMILRFVEEYADAKNAHRALTEDVRFLEPIDRERVLAGERRVVAAFADAVAEIRPGTAAAAMDKPLTMLLFGMINWMFTWMRPGGTLTHADMAPIVADLFFGGLGAVRLNRKRTRRIARVALA